MWEKEYRQLVTRVVRCKGSPKFDSPGHLGCFFCRLKPFFFGMTIPQWAYIHPLVYIPSVFRWYIPPLFCGDVLRKEHIKGCVRCVKIPFDAETLFLRKDTFLVLCVKYIIFWKNLFPQGWIRIIYLPTPCLIHHGKRTLME